MPFICSISHFIHLDSKITIRMIKTRYTQFKQPSGVF
jgi:hypothetical protein